MGTQQIVAQPYPRLGDQWKLPSGKLALVVVCRPNGAYPVTLRYVSEPKLAGHHQDVTFNPWTLRKIGRLVARADELEKELT